MNPIRCPNCSSFTPVTSKPVDGRVRVRCRKCGMSVSVRVRVADAEAPAAPIFEDAAASPPPVPAAGDEMIFATPEEPEAPAELLLVAMARLWKEKATGTLRVTDARGEHQIMLRSGEAVGYASPEPRVSLLSVLRDTRRITPQVHAEWHGKGLGADDLPEALVSAGVVDQPRIASALARGCELLVHDLAAGDPEIRFDAGPSGPRRLKVVMEKVILDALRQSVPLPRLTASLPEPARCLRFVQGAHALFQSLPLSDDEQRLLTLVDGKRTFGDLVAATAEPDGAVRSIFALSAFGVLEAGDLTSGWQAPPGFRLPDAASPPPAAPSASRPAPPPEPPPPARAAPPPPVRPAAAPKAPPPGVSAPPARPASGGDHEFAFVMESDPVTTARSTPSDADGSAEFIFDARVAPAAARPSPGPPPPVDAGPPPASDVTDPPAPWMGLPPADDLLAVLEELRGFLQGSEEWDYYQLLHLSPTADSKTIKRHYFAFAKRYHPDKFYVLGDDRLRQDVDTYYTRVTVAFETLKDEDRRAEYERTLRRPPEEVQGSHNDLILAELKFQDANDAFLQKNLAQARELVTWAIRLNGAKAKYHALLGRSHFAETGPSRDLAAALHAFRRAAELEPDEAAHLVHAGQALLLSGSLVEARKSFQQALAVDPGCIDAKREIRLMEMRAAGQAAKAPDARPAAPAGGKPEPEKKKVGFFGKVLRRL